jgi:hypothetical protein
MKQYSVTRNGKEFFVRIHRPDNADVFYKVVNPKTGKGWQAARDVQHFEGPRAQGRALVAWMKAARLTGGAA